MQPVIIGKQYGSGDAVKQVKKNPVENATKYPSVSKKIIIRRAGFGGICGAYELMKKGHEVGQK